MFAAYGTYYVSDYYHPTGNKRVSVRCELNVAYQGITNLDGIHYGQYQENMILKEDVHNIIKTSMGL